MNDERQFILRDSAGDIHYGLRISQRAKHVRLRVSPGDGLVIVVPRGFDPGQVPGIVATRKAWIRRALEKTAVPSSEDGELPETLFLKSVGEEWRVSRSETKSLRGSFREQPGRVLEIGFRPDDPEGACGMLRAWVKKKAERELLPWLDEIASSQGFRFGRGVIRHQKTRWASCSAKATISLNMKLLFLPPELVEYIMLHELCHTVHMNHSRRFWEHVASFMPDCRERDRAMKDAFRHVPRFVL
ncbi:hypothetical protein CHL67_07435 [Prosthecochloris sp. GSB1]|uniref:M48 family metallopeptidase n=1 Tax=Prosthecochloris sp. GSB1 TaxID=281093 RepID=UPI000B8CBD53|nr:SprT family zinc-dependent metalloprotease [Prosthecochloris sp. GSB1]ASQ90775.1 hypothetical protein CHL67_07435 [Prosthecochloris sp. GSB1]